MAVPLSRLHGETRRNTVEVRKVPTKLRPVALWAGCANSPNRSAAGCKLPRSSWSSAKGQEAGSPAGCRRYARTTLPQSRRTKRKSSCAEVEVGQLSHGAETRTRRTSCGSPRCRLMSERSRGPQEVPSASQSGISSPARGTRETPVLDRKRPAVGRLGPAGVAWRRLHPENRPPLEGPESLTGNHFRGRWQRVTVNRTR